MPRLYPVTVEKKSTMEPCMFCGHRSINVCPMGGSGGSIRTSCRSCYRTQDPNIPAPTPEQIAHTQILERKMEEIWRDRM